MQYRYFRFHAVLVYFSFLLLSVFLLLLMSTRLAFAKPTTVHVEPYFLTQPLTTTIAPTMTAAITTAPQEMLAFETMSVPIPYDPKVVQEIFQDHRGIVLIDKVETFEVEISEFENGPFSNLIIPWLENLHWQQTVNEPFFLQTTRHFQTLDLVDGALGTIEDTAQLEILLLIQNPQEAILLYNSDVYDEAAQFVTWVELPLIDSVQWNLYSLPFDGVSPGSQRGQIDQVLIERQFNITAQVPCIAPATVSDFLACAEASNVLQNVPWQTSMGRLLTSQLVDSEQVHTLWLFGEFVFNPFTCNETRVIQYTSTQNHSVFVSNCGFLSSLTTRFWPTMVIPLGCQEACSCSNCECWFGVLCVRPR